MMEMRLKPAVFRIFSIFGTDPARAKEIRTRTIEISQNRHCRLVSPKVSPVAAGATTSAGVRFSKNRNRPTGKAISSGSNPKPTHDQRQPKLAIPQARSGLQKKPNSPVPIMDMPSANPFRTSKRWLTATVQVIGRVPAPTNATRAQVR